MKRKMFRELNDLELKAKFAKTLLEKTKGGLTKEEVKKIINSINTNQCKIKIINDAKTFAKEIILINHKMEHSWAGEEKLKEKGKIIIGEREKFSFGTNYKYQYYDNGNLTTDEEEYERPEFNIEEKYVILKEKSGFSNYNNNYYDYKTYYLIIYLPDNNPYKMDEKIKFLIDFLGIK